MNLKINLIITALLAILMAPGSHAADSAQHTSQGSKHSVVSAAHLASGAVKIAAGSVAIPLVSVGVTGTVSLQTGEALINFATGKDDQPLPIADDVIVAGPSPKTVLASEGEL